MGAGQDCMTAKLAHPAICKEVTDLCELEQAREISLPSSKVFVISFEDLEPSLLRILTRH